MLYTHEYTKPQERRGERATGRTWGNPAECAQAAREYNQSRENMQAPHRVKVTPCEAGADAVSDPMESAPVKRVRVPVASGTFYGNVALYGVPADEVPGDATGVLYTVGRGDPVPLACTEQRTGTDGVEYRACSLSYGGDTVPGMWFLSAEAYEWRRAAAEARRCNHKGKGVPWADEEWYTGNPATVGTFYLHADEAGMVRYVRDEKAGMQGTWTTCKPGRFLSREFGDVLSDGEVQEWALAWDNAYAPLPLKLARTESEITDVYENGPRSCMSGPAADFSSRPYQPAAVYAAGDLAVAYIGEQGAAHARALCWPEKKVYGVPYGDRHRIIAALEKEGYRESEWGDFNGARLQELHSESGVLVMPYLDEDYGYENVYSEEHGEHCLVMSTHGEHAGYCNGVAGPGAQCVECGEAWDEEEMLWSEHFEAYMCEDCYSERHVYCENCCVDQSSEGAEPVGDETWCADCAAHDAEECSACGEQHPLDTMERLSDNSATYCGDCAPEYVSECVTCCEVIPSDTACPDEYGDPMCEECNEEYEADKAAEEEDGEEW